MCILCLFSIFSVVQRHLSVFLELIFFSRNPFPHVLNSMFNNFGAFTLSSSMYRELREGVF